MNTFDLVLHNAAEEDGEWVIPIEVYDSPTARKWFRELVLSCSIPRPLSEVERFYGFPGDVKNTREWTCGEINRCIDVINSAYPGLIDKKATPDMSQEHFNDLHTYFERYRGSIWNPTRYYLEGSRAVKDAFTAYNVTIHRFERNIRSEPMHEKGIYQPRATVTFRILPRTRMTDEDYTHFTLKRRTGEICVDYNEVGKHLWETCVDEDEMQGEDNIRPLRFIAASFEIWFGPDTSEQELREHEAQFSYWFRRNKQWLENLGFVEGDSKNAVGYLPVAQISPKFVEELGGRDHLIHKMAKHLRVKRIDIPILQRLPNYFRGPLPELVLQRLPNHFRGRSPSSS